MGNAYCSEVLAGCAFFLSHHETLNFYTYLPYLMVALVQKQFFFNIGCYLVPGFLHQICIIYIFSVVPICMYICMVVCMYVCMHACMYVLLF